MELNLKQRKCVIYNGLFVGVTEWCVLNSANLNAGKVISRVRVKPLWGDYSPWRASNCVISCVLLWQQVQQPQTYYYVPVERDTLPSQPHVQPYEMVAPQGQGLGVTYWNGYPYPSLPNAPTSPTMLSPHTWGAVVGMRLQSVCLMRWRCLKARLSDVAECHSAGSLKWWKEAGYVVDLLRRKSQLLVNDSTLYAGCVQSWGPLVQFQGEIRPSTLFVRREILCWLDASWKDRFNQIMKKNYVYINLNPCPKNQILTWTQGAVATKFTYLSIFKFTFIVHTKRVLMSETALDVLVYLLQ